MRVNKTKYFLVVGVLLAIAGVTLGFAAFSNTLTIKSSATVTPDASTFNVTFRQGTVEPSIDNSLSATATDATLNNSTISNILLNFYSLRSINSSNIIFFL